MINFIYPNRSCTLYSKYELLNTGSDEVMEITSDFDINDIPIKSRILLNFTDTDLFSNYDNSNRFILHLKILQNMELEQNAKLNVFPVSKSWEGGRGRFSDAEYLYPGASWIYRNSKKERWDTETPVEYDSGGGSWFSEIEITDLDINKKIDISFDFNKNISDVNLDITELVNYWKDNSIPNNGLLVKFSDDTKVCGNVKFFSNNTNTIYSPYIAICRFDYIFSPHVNETQKDTKQIDSGSLDSGSLDSGSLDSGSLDSGSLDSGSLDSGSLDSGSLDSGSLDSGSYNVNSNNPNSQKTDLIELTGNNIITSVINVKEQYNKNTTERVDVGVRYKFPTKTFQNRMRYSHTNFTRSEMYYSIKDAETEEVVIDFSQFTKISCDVFGHFFMFNFNCLNRGRFYRWSLKINNGSHEQIFSDNRSFLIVT